jgi:hypothetical protein
MPLIERHVTAARLSTAVLEGGDGVPIMLLHGPGESAVNWRWVAPDLVTSHRVIAPDLPAQGSTASDPTHLDEGGVLAWLDELIERTCAERPIVVGPRARRGDPPPATAPGCNARSSSTRRAVDDPPRDKPVAFLRALLRALDGRPPHSRGLHRCNSTSPTQSPNPVANRPGGSCPP